MIGSCSDDSDPQWLLDVTSKSGGATSFLLDQEPVTGPQIWFWDADRGGTRSITDTPTLALQDTCRI